MPFKAINQSIYCIFCHHSQLLLISLFSNEFLLLLFSYKGNDNKFRLLIYFFHNLSIYSFLSLPLSYTFSTNIFVDKIIIYHSCFAFTTPSTIHFYQSLNPYTDINILYLFGERKVYKENDYYIALVYKSIKRGIALDVWIYIESAWRGLNDLKSNYRG